MMARMIPPDLRQAFERALDAPVERVSPVGGGDINQAAIIETRAASFFVKFNELPQAEDMLRTEAEGLRLLGQSQRIRVPEVIDTGNAGGIAYLLLEHIRTGRKTGQFWEQFGQALARLHRDEKAYFGLSFDNYIGSLPQYNGRYKRFAEFYVEKRLQPQLRMAMEKGLLNTSDAGQMENLYRRLDDLLPAEPPSLIHGDLWGGNYLVSEDDRGVLIDPAIAFAHREMDLAMSLLFGGFDPRFYKAYQDTYPTEKELESRLPLYQLYYLLVHVNLFGSSYAGSVRRILRQFA
jgi:protein-ribulosamine 3-kinase